jgi:hypothetical protein
VPRRAGRHALGQRLLLDPEPAPKPSSARVRVKLSKRTEHAAGSRPVSASSPVRLTPEHDPGGVSGVALCLSGRIPRDDVSPGAMLRLNELGAWESSIALAISGARLRPGARRVRAERSQENPAPTTTAVPRATLLNLPTRRLLCNATNVQSSVLWQFSPTAQDRRNCTIRDWSSRIGRRRTLESYEILSSTCPGRWADGCRPPPRRSSWTATCTL